MNDKRPVLVGELAFFVCATWIWVNAGVTPLREDVSVQSTINGAFSSLGHLILRFPIDLLLAIALCQLIKSIIETIGRNEIRLRDLDALVDGS